MARAAKRERGIEEEAGAPAAASATGSSSGRAKATGAPRSKRTKGTAPPPPTTPWAVGMVYPCQGRPLVGGPTLTPVSATGRFVLLDRTAALPGDVVDVAPTTEHSGKHVHVVIAASDTHLAVAPTATDGGRVTFPKELVENIGGRVIVASATEVFEPLTSLHDGRECSAKAFDPEASRGEVSGSVPRPEVVKACERAWTKVKKLTGANAGSSLDDCVRTWAAMEPSGKERPLLRRSLSPSPFCSKTTPMVTDRREDYVHLRKVKPAPPRTIATHLFRLLFRRTTRYRVVADAAVSSTLADGTVRPS